MTRWLEKWKLQQEKRLEKEKLRKEKKKLKEKELRRLKYLKRLERKKERTRKRNHHKQLVIRRRYCRKIAYQKKKERIKNGDKFARFDIYITLNGKKIRHISTKRWYSECYQKYCEIIESNKQKVLFPTKIKRQGNNIITTNYEIILTGTFKKTDTTDFTYKDEFGKNITAIVDDIDNCIIIDKQEWRVETLFYIFGVNTELNPDYHYIYNNFIINDNGYLDNMKKIMYYNNKLIIQTINDFDLIKCSNEDECKELYYRIEEDCQNLEKENFIFMGAIAKGNIPLWKERIEEKTGWDKNTIRHTSSYVITMK